MIIILLFCPWISYPEAYVEMGCDCSGILRCLYFILSPRKLIIVWFLLLVSEKYFVILGLCSFLLSYDQVISVFIIFAGFPAIQVNSFSNFLAMTVLAPTMVLGGRDAFFVRKVSVAIQQCSPIDTVCGSPLVILPVFYRKRCVHPRTKLLHQTTGNLYWFQFLKKPGTCRKQQTWLSLRRSPRQNTDCRRSRYLNRKWPFLPRLFAPCCYLTQY